MKTIKYQILLHQAQMNTVEGRSTLISILYVSKEQAEKDAIIMRICFPFSHTEIREVEVEY